MGAPCLRILNYFRIITETKHFDSREKPGNARISAGLAHFYQYVNIRESAAAVAPRVREQDTETKSPRICDRPLSTFCLLYSCDRAEYPIPLPTFSWQSEQAKGRSVSCSTLGRKKVFDEPAGEALNRARNSLRVKQNYMPRCPKSPVKKRNSNPPSVTS